MGGERKKERNDKRITFERDPSHQLHVGEMFRQRWRKLHNLVPTRRVSSLLEVAQSIAL